jgi:peptide/nickel transport system permease protein
MSSSQVPLPASVVAKERPQTSREIASRGYWAETWFRFRKKQLPMIALAYVLFMAVTAILSPVIVGTKPLLVYYKGSYAVPAVGYFRDQWETPMQVSKDLGRRYSPERLKAADADSWAVWPLVFQDPYRRVRDGEWPSQPGNPTGNDGRPNRVNLLGTTQEGIDVFAQIVHGTRTALLVGFVTMGIAASIGITLGALAGYFGSWVDLVISRIIEVVMCIPTLVLILALLAIVPQATIWHLMAVIGITSWPGIARLTRGEFLKLRTVDYVVAARALGAGWVRVIVRHILPNSLAPVLVPITFGIAAAILIENALSFLGFGSPPPTASWGNLLNAGQRNLGMWWLIVFPGTAIFLTVLAYNLIGEGLQEATDPRLRESQK